MGKWLDKLKNHENARSRHCQNRQNTENSPSGSFGGAYSGRLQKKIAVRIPAIWDVTIQNNSKLAAMTVIDPKRDSDEVFMRGLHDRFGVDRVITAKRRK